MKNKLRKVHVDAQEWKFVVATSNNLTINEIRIYSPKKRMWRVKPDDISKAITYDELGGDKMHMIQPQMVKDYIINKLL